MSLISDWTKIGICTRKFVYFGPYSETWYKALPAVLLGSVSRETQKCQFYGYWVFRDEV